MNQINSAQTGISIREELKEKMAYDKSRKGLAVNELIRQYLNEDTIGLALEKVIAILKTEGRIIDKRREICAHIKKREYATAEATISDIHPDGILDNFCKLMTTVIELKQEPESEMALKTAPVMEAQVRVIAQDTIHQTHFKAQNLLKLVFNDSFPETIAIPLVISNKKGWSQTENETPSDPEMFWLEENHNLKNFPNPFGYYTSIEAFVPDYVKKSNIVIYNLAGIVVKKYPLLNGYNIVTVLRDDVPSNGVYFYSLVADGRKMATGKMIAIK